MLRIRLRPASVSSEGMCRRGLMTGELGFSRVSEGGGGPVGGPLFQIDPSRCLRPYRVLHIQSPQHQRSVYITWRVRPLAFANPRLQHRVEGRENTAAREGSLCVSKPLVFRTPSSVGFVGRDTPNFLRDQLDEPPDDLVLILPEARDSLALAAVRDRP